MKKPLAEIIGKKRAPPKKDGGRAVIAYFETSDETAAAAARQLILEGRDIPIDNRYSARLDRGHVPGMQDHLHIQFNGRDVCIVNRDGTPSHNTDVSVAPQYVLDFLRTNNWITEATLQKTFGLPESVIRVAIARLRSAELYKKLRQLMDTPSKRKKSRI
jgi:hypothetical protein